MDKVDDGIAGGVYKFGTITPAIPANINRRGSFKEFSSRNCPLIRRSFINIKDTHQIKMIANANQILNTINPYEISPSTSKNRDRTITVSIDIAIEIAYFFDILVPPYLASAQRFALPALGRGRRSRPTGKMIRRRKLLEICAESPASGARFVRRFCVAQDSLTKETITQISCEF